MKRFITATENQRDKMKKIFKCGDRMIHNALTYDENRGHSDLAKRIRMAAREMGCHTYVVVDEMECFFDSDGKMHQLFPNGAQIEISYKTGLGVIIHRGKVVAEYSNVTVSQIPAIQERAQAI